VPWLVPFTKTETAGSVSFVELFFMDPVSVTFCAKAETARIQASAMHKMEVLFLI
jgi:hypothetical protein